MTQFYSYAIQLAGLVCDIVGVCILFKFGIPEMIQTGGANVVTIGVDPVQKALEEKYWRLGYIGLFLLIIGFSLQLLPNVIGMYNVS
jgi:hypothetical protein